MPTKYGHQQDRNKFHGRYPQKDLRVTIIDPSGDVLFDNSGTDEFNNHNDRSEVRKARLYNEGFAIRSSESTGKRYFYSASNIGGYIYRSALPYDPYVRGILTVNKDFIYFMALMTLIFFFVLSRFTFSIGKTISKLRDFALNVEKDRMPAVDYVFPNDELGDISQNIVTLYHRQQKAKTSYPWNGKSLSNISNIPRKASLCLQVKGGRFFLTSYSFNS